MSALMRRISVFLRSPKGKQLIARGQQELAKPANQQKLRGLASRLGRRR